MSVPKTPEQWAARRKWRRESQQRKRERIRRGELINHLCRVCTTAPVYVSGGRCKACYLKNTRKGSGRPVDVCFVCEKAPVSGIGQRCKACYLTQESKLIGHQPPSKRSKGEIRTQSEALAHDAEIARKKNLARRELEPERYMMVAPGEYWLKAPKCRVCGKHIMYAGTCYTCSTGRSRQVLRREERTLG